MRSSRKNTFIGMFLALDKNKGHDHIVDLFWINCAVRLHKRIFPLRLKDHHIPGDLTSGDQLQWRKTLSR